MSLFDTTGKGGPQPAMNHSRREDTMKKSINLLLAALLAGGAGTAAFAQTTHDPAADPTTHADKKAAKEQAKADKKGSVAQAKADKEKTEAQSDADKAAADARVKDAKKQSD
jgi:hypothetical protein